MRAGRALLLLPVALAGCPLHLGSAGASVSPAPSAETSSASATPTHAPTEAEALRPKLHAVEKEVRAANAALEEALWTHWTTGAPLELSKAQSGHEWLTSAETFALLKRARTLGADEPRALELLERHLQGELLARALAEPNASLANFEASLTVTVDGKEIAFRDVTRVLAAEKSAVKRKALWSAALKAAELLDAQHVARNAKAREVLATLEAPSMLQLATETRDLDPDASAYAADELLQLTDAAWGAALEGLSKAELKLPRAKLTRADLPRLMRVPFSVDAAFPKAQVPARGIKLLELLGFGGETSLRLDLAEASKKNPLPLTVAPGGAKDVRLSFRPLGGLRDQGVLFAELGTALALRHVTAGRYEYERLGDPGVPQVTAALFEALLASPEFLEDLGVAADARSAVAEAFRVQRLHRVRRDAGLVLARLETQGLDDAAAREVFTDVMARALAVRHEAADGARWRLEVEDFLRSASALRAAALAEQVRAQLEAAHGSRWWTKPAAREALLALWAPGTSQGLEARLGSQLGAVHLLTVALGGVHPEAAPGLAVPWPRPETVAGTDGGVGARAPRSAFEWRALGTPLPSDAGTGALAKPWPRPEAVADAGGVGSGGTTVAQPSPKSGTIADGGDAATEPAVTAAPTQATRTADAGATLAKPWPRPETVADGGGTATQTHDAAARTQTAGNADGGAALAKPWPRPETVADGGGTATQTHDAAARAQTAGNADAGAALAKPWPRPETVPAPATASTASETTHDGGSALARPWPRPERVAADAGR